MIATMCGVAMAKKGRPRKDDQDTRMVRVNGDIADMIGWIIKVRKEAGDKDATAATLIDPLIRPGVTAMYEEIKTSVERMKRLRKSIAEEHGKGKP